MGEPSVSAQARLQTLRNGRSSRYSNSFGNPEPNS